MLKLKPIQSIVIENTGTYRTHAKAAMFETDPVKKAYLEGLARNAMERGESLRASAGQ